MRLIKPSFEIIEQQAGLEGMYKQIERAGRVCYKSSPKYRWYSEDKKRWINEDSEEWKAIENPKKEYPIRGENISAKPFVDRMIASGHGAMLEHGTIYLKFTAIIHSFNRGYLGGLKYKNNPYSKVVLSKDDTTQYVTTNLRVLVENGWMDDLKYICEPTEYHEKRVTVRFICDRGVSHEFVRHRVFSFAQESTRYCNYSKDKFGSEVTFIEPCWIKDNQDTYDRWCFYESLSKSEEVYFRLLKHGWKPQEARAVLPNSLKTELVMTGFVSDWEHFFKLRDAGSAHPQAQELAHPLHMEFLRRGYIKDLYK